LKATEAFRERIDACWEAAHAVEPTRGAVTEAQLVRVREAIEAAMAAHLSGVDGATGGMRSELESALANAIARAAALAIAAENDELTTAWLANARRFSKSSEQREELDAAKRSPEHYRQLVQDGDSVGDRIHEDALRERDAEGDDRHDTRPGRPPSRRARLRRAGMFGAAALAVAGYFVFAHYHDPSRLPRKRFDDAISAKGDPARALERLDAELEGPDLARVDTGRAQRAGAAVVRLIAGFVSRPITRERADEVARVVARYQRLPPKARGGAAQEAMLRQLDVWVDDLGAPADREARLAVLRHAWTLADRAHAEPYAERIATVRVEVAAAKATDWPLDALSVLVEEPVSSAAMAQATHIVARIVDQPSLLEDAGADLDAWRQATSNSEPLRAKVEAQRALAIHARSEVEADGVTPEQLAAMQIARPWDQRVAAALAAEELHGGKPEAAEARLRAFGSEGMLVRDARFLLAQIAASREQLDVADAILTRLLDARLSRFQVASSALDAAEEDVRVRLNTRIERDDLPPPLRERLEDGRDEEAQQTILGEWYGQEMDAEPTVAARRKTYLEYSDIVPVALAAGTIELRRAQSMEGSERDAMLTRAERTFLAIRAAAEGDPEYHLALGEIYARLGKHDESETELKTILDRKDPDLTREVVTVYREIGSIERATTVATEAYDAFPSHRESFAALLGVIYSDDDVEGERWFRKANQDNPYVRSSLLEIEGRKLGREGKDAECADAFAKAARIYLAASDDATGFNNAAVAHQNRYECNGDPRSLDDAVVALERAYRLEGQDAIVINNLASSLDHRGNLRVLSRRVDTRRLRLSASEAWAVLDGLLAGADRDAVLGEMTADPDLRRARDLMRQYEVLAPNSIDGYRAQLAWARAKRDGDAAAGVLERARLAKALDTIRARQDFADQVANGDSEHALAVFALRLAQIERVLAQPHVDAHTQAVALRLRGYFLVERGVRDGVAADITDGRASMRRADELWPAAADVLVTAGALIDEIAIAHDPARWAALRRTRNGIGALSKLVADRDPLGDTIRGAPTWEEVRTTARADQKLPGSDYLRFAQLVDDPAVTARARAALDDGSLRAYYELRALEVPADDDAAAILKLLGGR
jgi:cellulose synthase operon protein C